MMLITLGLLLLMLAAAAGCTPQAAPVAPTQAAAPADPTDAPAATEAPVPTEAPETTQAPEMIDAPTATEASTLAAPAAVGLAGDPVRGGLLYDKWWAVLGTSVPEGDHPLWSTQTSNTRSGEDTWRCKECHGWDYKGVDGAYGSGSHMTGFPGILAAMSKPAGDLLAALDGRANPEHDFSAYMQDQDLADLTAFVQRGLMDTAEMVDGEKMVVSADADRGEELFSQVCTNCHGPQGSAINFGNLEELEYVGVIAADNPWEFIHKVRFGAPGWPMPSSILLEWSDQDVADVLAYAQHLSNDPLVSYGGLLYDKWWAVLGMSVPEGDHPLWSTQTSNTRSGEDTWRCKECHGWDYKGMDGAYGSGSHMTGFVGVLGAASLPTEELAAHLTGKTNAGHDFSQYMDERAISALVAFVQKEAADVSSVVKSASEVVGDAARGEEMYQATCAGCHGEDGAKLNFGDADDPEYVGTIAVDNPWEFLHKVTHGQPGQPMPAGLALGWSLEQLGDLLAFARTLPVQ